jgi:hypothetical protein
MIPGVNVTFRCKECEGTGYNSSGHPNDPSSTDVICRAECDNGEVTHFDELTTLEDAKEDYPDAIRFQVVAPDYR